MRTYVNGTIYNALPSELQNVIVSTKVISGHGSTAGETNFETQDKLYLLSGEEIYGDFASSTDGEKDSSLGTSRQLEYYKNEGVTTDNSVGAKKQYSGNNFLTWWLRSVHSKKTDGYLGVSSNGECVTGPAYSSDMVSPAFRIA